MNIALIGLLVALAPFARASDAAFIPADNQAVGLWGGGKKLVAGYQFRLEFYTLGKEITLEPQNGRDYKILRANKEISLNKLKPSKVITFKNPIKIDPNWPRDTTTNLLVCTQSLGAYAPMTEDERAKVYAINQMHSIQATNPKGDIQDFCGIISVSGDVVYQFKISPNPPTELFTTSGISRDGKRALIVSGEATYSDEAPGAFVRARRGILWTYPDTETAITSKDPNDSGTNNWRLKFLSGEFDSLPRKKK